MGEFSPMHILIVLVVAILLFGNRLPNLGKSLGQGLREFKRAISGDDEPPRLT